ncbi:TcfC E-set like domain-containing protein [Parendozoicomonas haliclonae]|uniref:Fimbrial Usher protein n=1 Tax=Parendozoicomonas haliclonae TaxID=1960125 RepID=A0A1X7AG51_9GAMM|nr:TcfC E-set like domain-containing protein [Parendozoicomonas haliclonae]SMA39318.1 hypothetical protein EHSB41UT_01010 [Parendozoicomonas haliclonae]
MDTSGRINNYPQVFSWLISALLLVVCALASGDDDIPEGFEDIDAPRTTQVNIWYGGRQRGQALAEFTSQWIRFRQPARVAKMIPGLVDEPAIIEALSQQLPANKEKICHSEKQKLERLDCGFLEPSTIGTIFDATHFRASLFVSPSQLKLKAFEQARFLSEPTSDRVSVIQGLSLSLSGARAKDSSDHYSWYGRSVAALGESHLFSDWSYDKSEHFNVTSLFVERDWEGQELVGGLFNGSSFGLSFSADPQLLGIRIAHSQDSMNNEFALNTTPITVYLPTRGRVEIYKDNKLIDARILSAGRQQLDTRGFPQGAYNLTIKIYDGARLLEEKKQLFVKSNNLPGSDDPLYFLEVGRPMDNVAGKWWPRTGKGWIVRGGYSRLLDDITGLTVSATVENSDALGEVEVLQLRDEFEWSAGVMLARHNRSGVFGNVLGSSEWFEHSVQWQGLYRELSAQGEDSTDGQILGTGFRNGQVSAATVLGQVTVDLGRDWQKDENAANSRITDHFRMDWSLIRDAWLDLRFGLETSRSFGNGERSSQVLVNLTLTRRSSNREWTLQQNRQENRQGNQSEIELATRAGARWQDLQWAGQDLSAGGFVEKEREQASLGADVSFASRWAAGRAAVNRSMPDNSENVTTYVANLSTSVLANPDEWALGGRQLSVSAILVELGATEASSGTFSILVNGRSVAQGQAGETVPVILAPYRSYRIGIKPAGDSFADFDEREKEVTLYPGNVAKLGFTITALEPVLGRLVDKQGEALADAVIENSHDQAITDSHGVFQARLKLAVKQLEIKRANGQTCTVPRPEQPRKRRGVLMLGTLICK